MDAPIGHDYEIGDDARQVAVVSRCTFLAYNVIRSTILSNNIIYVDVYEHNIKRVARGNNHNVFVFSVAADAVCASHNVLFLAHQLHGRSVISGVEPVPGKLRFSMTRATSMNQHRLLTI
jgi:hypothetical protein